MYCRYRFLYTDMKKYTIICWLIVEYIDILMQNYEDNILLYVLSYSSLEIFMNVTG